MWCAADGMQAPRASYFFDVMPINYEASKNDTTKKVIGMPPEIHLSEVLRNSQPIKNYTQGMLRKLHNMAKYGRQVLSSPETLVGHSINGPCVDWHLLVSDDSFPSTSSMLCHLEETLRFVLQEWNDMPVAFIYKKKYENDALPYDECLKVIKNLNINYVTIQEYIQYHQENTNNVIVFDRETNISSFEFPIVVGFYHFLDKIEFNYNIASRARSKLVMIGCNNAVSIEEYKENFPDANYIISNSNSYSLKRQRFNCGTWFH